MARESKTKYAVLGLLSWHPMSGYDIRRVYEATLGGFWNESYGQIYPVLRQLVAEGLAEESREESLGRPGRKVYAVTEAGRDALSTWLGGPTEPDHLRIELLLKMLHGFQAPPAVMAAQVRRYRDERAAALDGLAGMVRDIKARAGGPFDHAVPYWLLCGRYAELVGTAVLQWCDEALGVLEGLETDDRLTTKEPS